MLLLALLVSPCAPTKTDASQTGVREGGANCPPSGSLGKAEGEKITPLPPSPPSLIPVHMLLLALLVSPCALTKTESGPGAAQAANQQFHKETYKENGRVPEGCPD